MSRSGILIASYSRIALSAISLPLSRLLDSLALAPPKANSPTHYRSFELQPNDTDTTNDDSDALSFRYTHTHSIPYNPSTSFPAIFPNLLHDSSRQPSTTSKLLMTFCRSSCRRCDRSRRNGRGKICREIGNGLILVYSGGEGARATLCRLLLVGESAASGRGFFCAPSSVAPGKPIGVSVVLLP